MLSQEEENFMVYWQQHRLQKRKWIKQLAVGLPMALALIAGISVNLFSGWYTRAQMVMFRESASLIIVLLVAAIALVVFMVIFSSRHRWDQYEQRYLELVQRKSNLSGTTNETS
ncbi:MAG: hypothetical protein ACKO41_05120 [Sphingomonadales bacterium]